MRRLLVALIAGILLAAAGATPASAQEEPDKPTYVDGTEPAFDGMLWVTETVILDGGERVEYAPVGRPFVLRMTFLNQSEERANDVVVRLDELMDGWSVVDARARLGDLAPGDSAKVSFDVTIPERPCEIYAGIGGTTTSSLGDQPFKTGLAVDCPGPRLYATEVIYRGGDGDGVPEPGERLDVIVVVVNEGRDPATNVVGTLEIAGGDVEVIERRATWPVIEPGTSERNTEPFVIKVSPDADRAPECQPYVIEDLPAEDADDPVSSDGTVVSSDGTVSGGGGGSAPDDGSAGGSEPGSAGSGGSTGTVEPEPADEDPAQEPPAEEPVREPPDGTTMIAPDEPGDDPKRVEDPAREPEPQDQPVPFEGKLLMEASGETAELYVGNGAYCALAERMDDGALGAPAAGAPGFDEDAREVATKSARGGAGYATIVAALAILAVGWSLGRRWIAQRAASM